MRRHWLPCFLALAAWTSSSLLAQTFEARFVQVLGTDADTLHFEIRQTGTTSFVLSTASFLLNYNNAALGSPTLITAYDGPWSSEADQDYNDLKSIPVSQSDTAARFAGLLVEFVGGQDNDGPTVPESFTRIGTLSFPIRNRNLTPGFTWRGVGTTTQVTRLAQPGSTGETEITGGGTFIPADDGPLPIQLASFTATALGGNRVRLDWVTISELGNYGFEIQKSPSTPISYQTLPNSFVSGHGTTNEPHVYSFIDTTASPGQWLYRLRQIDLSGREHFTDGVQVIVTDVVEKPLPKAFSLAQNYPNPFNPSTRIEYALPREAHVRLEVYNVLGQRVAVLVNEVKQAGYYTVSFDASGFGSGLYFYQMRVGEVTFTKRMMVVK